MRRIVLVVAVACGAVLAGCGAGGSNGSAAAVGPVAAPANGLANGAARAAAPAAGSGTAKNQQLAQPPLSVPGRQIVRSATIGVRVPDIGTAEGDVRRITTAAGGYEGQENDGGGQASFTLQVPQAGLEGVLDQVARLGTTTSRTEQAQDVTDQMVDVRSRVATQQASVDRVRALMDKATTIGDVVSIESELTKREADLESLEQQQTELSSQVAMSAVTVQLTQASPPPAPAAAAGPTGFVGGLAAGWHAFLAALGVLLLVLGAVLPFLIVIGGAGALVWWALRRRRHRAVTPAPTETG